MFQEVTLLETEMALEANSRAEWSQGVSVGGGGSLEQGAFLPWPPFLPALRGPCNSPGTYIGVLGFLVSFATDGDAPVN